MKCQICGKGEVVEKEERNHKTMVLGREVTIGEAIVGRCDTCGAVNYAFRKVPRKTVIKLVCGWCGKDMGEKDGEGVEGISHVMCEECYAKALEELGEA